MLKIEKTLSAIFIPRITKTTNKKSLNDKSKETLQVTPRVKRAKNIISSKGLLTGFLNLTIDKAPTIPNDSAKSPLITEVRTNAILGNKI